FPYTTLFRSRLERVEAEETADVARAQLGQLVADISDVLVDRIGELGGAITVGGRQHPPVVLVDARRDHPPERLAGVDLRLEAFCPDGGVAVERAGGNSGEEED